MLLVLYFVFWSLLMFAWLGAVAWCGAMALCSRGWGGRIVGFGGMWCLLLLMGGLNANNGAAMRAILSFLAGWAR